MHNTQYRPSGVSRNYRPRKRLNMSKTDVSTYIDLPYSVEISPEKYEDGRACYVARHPELPGCMSHGDTVEEAVASLREARELYIASLIDDGLEVPEPAAAETQVVPVSADIRRRDPARTASAQKARGR
jgi:predicted RNase H-like HicB family nuclease